MKNDTTKLAKIAEDLSRVGWTGNEELAKLLEDNTGAIALFKEATKQKSDGFIFGRSPQTGNPVNWPTPRYRNNVNLLRLLLLQAKMYESKGLYPQTEENYLAATRFLIHLSQQKYAILSAFIIQDICFDLIDPYLEQSITNKNFGQEYRKKLVNNLLTIQHARDDLQSALQEEAEGQKKAIQFLKIEKEFGPAYDYDKFIKKYNATIDQWMPIVYRSAKECKPEIYEQWATQHYKNELKQTQGLLNTIKYLFNEMFHKHKTLKQANADLLTDRLVAPYLLPGYSRITTKYCHFYEKLSLLINKVETSQ